MAINQQLADRLRAALQGNGNVEEKEMFRGVCFMVNGKMCICVSDEELMCRIGPDVYEPALERPGTRPMIHGKRVMKGFVYVHEDVLRSKKEFDYWVALALQFNQVAKAAKKKKTSPVKQSIAKKAATKKATPKRAKTISATKTTPAKGKTVRNKSR